MLRFIADRKKVVPGLERLSPDLLLINAEVRSPLLDEVLGLLRADGHYAAVPIALFCDDTYDAPFVKGLRGGVVELLKKPFDPKRHLEAVRALLAGLSSRPGLASGQADPVRLADLVEHLRGTRRSGVLTFNPRTAREASVAFTAGDLTGSPEVLTQLLARGAAEWSFREILGAEGEGAGVVIEVGSDGDADEEILIPDEQLPDQHDDSDGFDLTIEVAPPAPAPVLREGERVALLLVDDDPTLCKMFSTLFEKRGFAVASASDGLDGYQRARAGGFELVVADLNMPRMDGWGLLRLLRDDFHTRELPVAFLSCHDDYRDSLRALSSGAQGYFSKGTRLEALVNQVRELAAPRLAARRAIEAGEALSFDAGTLGAQWLLRELAAGKASGVLQAKDGWAKYEFVFVAGQLVHAAAAAGSSKAEGEPAIPAFIASRAALGTFQRQVWTGKTTLTGSLDERLKRACETLNLNEQRLRDGLLISANEIHVDRTLYALYQQVGPPEWVAGAKLICDEGLAPRELLARAEMSPLEVEEIFKDLLRRGVVTLRA